MTSASSSVGNSQYTVERKNTSKEQDKELGLHNTDEALHDLPAFHRHTEATNMDLFFDLCKSSV